MSKVISLVRQFAYLAELARLYDVAHLHARLLSSSFVLHVCPACVAEERRLSRLLTLPHITHCPQHQLSLVKLCQCGAPLRLFHRQARPFTCHKCGLDWKNLPQQKMDPERMEVEQHLLHTTTFSSPRERQRCLPARFDSSTTVWSRKGRSAFLSPTKMCRHCQAGEPIKELPRSAISSMPFGS